MRIGLVAPEFPPDIGGVQTYTWHMAKELATLGHEVTVFTQPHAVGDGTEVGFRVEPVLNLRRRQDRAIVYRYGMDVWHCMNAPYAWLSLEVTPVFVTVHGNDFLAPYHPVARFDLGISDRFDRWLGDLLTRRLVRRSLPRARHIFTNSRYTEGILLHHHPACRGRTSVASVGIAEEAFVEHQVALAPFPTRFITICRLTDREKNIPAVLKALARLRSAHDFHYTIVGDGELRPQLEGMAAALGLMDRVTFEGFVGPERKIDLLRSSDLFVLPALATARSCEGFGLVYLEANACGTPVLAARMGGAVEAVEEGISGYFVEEPTDEGVTSALSTFLRGDVSFTADACQRFAGQFSWRAVIGHCVEHYDEALGS